MEGYESYTKLVCRQVCNPSLLWVKNYITINFKYVFSKLSYVTCTDTNYDSAKFKLFRMPMHKIVRK